MLKKTLSNPTKGKSSPPATVPGYSFAGNAGGFFEYTLKKNGLRVLYYHMPGTGVVTTNITYLVGARDEARGETGLAHMLEHMLFKPTTFDRQRKVTAGSAMQFERETGCVLNANTWKDRTTYYFSYPAEYLERALQTEAERMEGVVLNKTELTPEQGNVLSEFDMYNGDPHFALAVQMCGVAFQSHPYGHETIGYREDIESYTPEKLERFYRQYYRPDNAVLMVIGDVDCKNALQAVKRSFGDLKAANTPVPRHCISEPKQEGIRRVAITRPSSTNIVSIGFKHAGFPTEDWFATKILFDVLTRGPESVLHKLLIDTGKAASIDGYLEPTSEENISTINIVLAPKQSHAEIEQDTLHAIRSVTAASISALIKKSKALLLTDELFERTQSLQIAQALTEYVAAGSWQKYTETPALLKQITPARVTSLVPKTFANDNLTIGYFIGKT